jgi:hypothetical protein
MEERKRRTLDELNLIDDFLMTELVGNEDYGREFIEYFLQVVLGQKVEVKEVNVQPHKDIT